MPSGPVKTDISFHVVDQNILLDLAKEKSGEGGSIRAEYSFGLRYLHF